jgi:hypothetical protein
MNNKIIKIKKKREVWQRLTIVIRRKGSQNLPPTFSSVCPQGGEF